MAIPSLSLSSGLLNSISRGRQTLFDLQRQLATGKLSETYGGLAPTSRITVMSLRAQMSESAAFQINIRDVNLRLDVVQQTVARFGEIASDTKAGAFQSPFDLVDGQQTAFQRNTRAQFDEMVSLLNSEINGRHLFAGRNSDVQPVLPAVTLLEGDGTRAGLKQLISERTQADVGAGGLGRLAISALTATSVRLAETIAGLPFGFKIAGVTNNLTGTTLTGPAGSPVQFDVDFTATPPVSGETIRILLDLPDGSQEALEFKAATATPPKAGEFAIGATPDVTAANFQTLLQSELSKRATGALSAASAVIASGDFFSGNKTTPPVRVDGPPFDTATATIAGTTANTIVWYQGDDSATPAREGALARIDDQLVVAYGTRADEQAVRHTLTYLGAISALTFNVSDPTAEDRYQALSQRAASGLAFPPSVQSFADITTELATVQRTLEAADERHNISKVLGERLISEREDADMEEVGASILTLQTRLQASFETTSIITQLSLVNFIR